MKGIVVEQKKKKAVVLCGNGEFREIADRGYRIGQEIELAVVFLPKTRILRYGVGVAAALMICTGGVFAYTTPTGYVSLDVNPSIAYSINMFDRVLTVTAVNEDSEEIVAALDLKNLPIDEALQETTAKLIEEGYLTDEDTGGVMITAYNKNEKKAEKLAAELGKSVQAELAEQGKSAEVESEPVGHERVLEAERLGVTPGKLNLVQKMMESTGETTTDAAIMEEWLDRSVKEINEEIKENAEVKSKIEKPQKNTEKEDELTVDESEQGVESDDAVTAEPQEKPEKAEPADKEKENNSDGEKDKKERAEENRPAKDKNNAD